MCILYLGTFGSFIGFAGFPLSPKKPVPRNRPVKYAFLGLGRRAELRPLGGWVSVVKSGALITQLVFAGMIVAVIGVISFCRATAKAATSGAFRLLYRPYSP